VNDRPYVASSFLSVAIARVLGSALAGTSKNRPDLAKEALPLEAKIAVLPCRGGEVFLRRLFEPLGYEVIAFHHALDEKFPEWGESPYYTVRLRATVRLQGLLTHLYVLVPVLDAEKHYWVGQDEVEKLLRHGEGWLAAHPEKEEIVFRYLKRFGRLAREALARLSDEDNPDPDAVEEERSREETVFEETLKLNDQSACSTSVAGRGRFSKRSSKHPRSRKSSAWMFPIEAWSERRKGCTSTAFPHNAERASS
jgi:3' terminal RNA ribose 2'-O-methyltransferase Hen1